MHCEHPVHLMLIWPENQTNISYERDRKVSHLTENVELSNKQQTDSMIYPMNMFDGAFVLERKEAFRRNTENLLLFSFQCMKASKINV